MAKNPCSFIIMLITAILVGLAPHWSRAAVITAVTTVDPDDFVEFQDLTSAVAGVTLSVATTTGEPTSTELNKVVVISGTDPSTGSFVFGRQIGDHFPDQFWFQSGLDSVPAVLRADFSPSTDFVSIDIINIGSADGGELRAFDASDNLLESSTATFSGLEAFVRASITRPTADIAYILAAGSPSGGPPFKAVALDNFQFNEITQLIITRDTILTEDQQGGIIIAADNITLDCNGFAVIGPGPSGGHGIILENRTGVTVKNCNVSQFEGGITLVESVNNQIIANSCSANQGNGFNALNGSDANVFHDNLASENGANGFVFESSKRNASSGDVARDNGEHGFAAVDSPMSSFRDCQASGNTSGAGLFLEWSSESTVVGVLSQGNVFGFFLVSSSDCTFTENRAAGNADGFTLFDSSDRNLFDRNEALNNSDFGFSLLPIGTETGGADNVFIDNWVEGSGQDGINLRHAANNRIERNKILRSDGNGITLIASGGNVIRHNGTVTNSGNGLALSGESNDNVVEMNQASRNQAGGVTVDGASSHNSLAMNQAMLNGEGGFSLLDGASNNTVQRNVACRNSIDAYDDETGVGNVWEANKFCTSDNM